MQTFFRVFIALTAAALLLAPPAALAQDTKKAAAAKADAPAKGKDLYTQSVFDFMLKQRLAQGQPDSPELRAAQGKRVGLTRDAQGRVLVSPERDRDLGR